MKIKSAKPLDILLLSIVLILTASLLLISNLTSNIVVFEDLSKPINKQILYQFTTLLLTLLFLIVLRWTKKNIFLEYFRKGNISAKISPEPYMGINPKPHENWYHIGRNLSIVISLVTFAVIYFQLIKDNPNFQNNFFQVIPFCILFALINSFVEECITRFGVVVALKDVLGTKTIPYVSALIFGIAHYWGNPGGFIGVIVAGFLGWLLTKSILETKGIFWAWFIHFLQDVIIFYALLSLA